MILTPLQIFELARRAGFTLLLAIVMTAIALRESGGKTDAFNGNTKTGDRSYGLWQINMLGGLSAPRMKQFGITDEKQLLDPVVNARAAFAIYAGKVSNIDMAWYFERPGPYRDRYATHLPAAIEAAMASPLGQVLKEV